MSAKRERERVRERGEEKRVIKRTDKAERRRATGDVRPRRNRPLRPSERRALARGWRVGASE